VPEPHVTARPVRTFPTESFVTALNCTPVAPTTIVGAVGLTVTEATVAGAAGGGAAMTVSLVVPLTVPLVAVIVAEPAATLVASPRALTVATLALLELHVTVRPVSTLPTESLVTALNCTPAAPTTAVGAAGVTVTEATDAGAGGGCCGAAAVTVSAVVLLAVPLVAVMVVEPAATLVANPLALMAATLGVAELRSHPSSPP